MLKGTISTLQKCPKCGGKFAYSEKTTLNRYARKGQSGVFLKKSLNCPTCFTTPDRYFIDIRWNKKRVRFYSDQDGNILSSYEQASKLLETVRVRINEHNFNPKDFLSAKKDYLFEHRIQAWYKSKEKEAEKENLAYSYTRGFDCYIRHYYLSFFQGMNVKDIKSLHIQEFYEQLPSKLSLKYIRNIMGALENFFNTLVRYEVITAKPIFPQITTDRKAPKWIDLEAQQEILKNIPEGHRPIFIFLALQGIRPSEARSLKVKDFNFTKEDIAIFTVQRTYSNRKIRERVKSKVVKPRVLDPTLTPMIKELCKDKLPEAFVFVSPRTKRPYSENVLRRIWNDTKDKLRKEKKLDGMDITLYEATRHSCATNLIRQGIPLPTVKDILGHTDIRTTMKYVQHDVESQKIALRKRAEVISLSGLSQDCKVKTTEEKAGNNA